MRHGTGCGITSTRAGKTFYDRGATTTEFNKKAMTITATAFRTTPNLELTKLFLQLVYFSLGFGIAQ